MATGSDVSLALAAADALNRDGVLVRVVWAPWLELHARFNTSLIDAIAPPLVPHVTIDAEAPDCRHGPARSDSQTSRPRRCGVSPPTPEARKRLAENVEHLRALAHDVLLAAAHEHR